LLVFLKR